VVAEVIASNPGKEVIIGSGCYFPEGSSAKRGAWVKVLSLKTGKVLRTFPIAACSNAEAAVGDIDGDGVQEIVFPGNGLASHGGDGIGRVYAWKAETSQLLWTATPRVNGTNDDEVGYFRGVSLSDIDGNGSLEVIVSNDTGIAILAGTTGASLTCEQTSCESGGLQEFAGFGSIKNTPAIVDITGDGVPELVAAGRSSSGAGLVRVWSGISDLIESSPGTLPQYMTPWPMFRGSANRNGTGE
jgi:hypothetical protein